MNPEESLAVAVRFGEKGPAFRRNVSQALYDRLFLYIACGVSCKDILGEGILKSLSGRISGGPQKDMWERGASGLCSCLC